MVGRGQAPKRSSGGGCGLLGIISLVFFIGWCSSNPRVPQSPTANSASSFPAALDWQYVSAGSLNCRAEPSERANRVASLSQGDSVGVQETRGGWSLVAANGNECWVAAQHLSPEAPVSEPPPLQAYSEASESGPADVGDSSYGASQRPERSSGAAFQCGSKRVCGQMDSCDEAYFHLNQCGLGRLDRDNDGVPCESICG